MVSVGLRKGTPVERFWSFVNKTDGCWLWTGKVDKPTHLRKSGGYGKFYIATLPTGRKHSEKPHRFSYKLHCGPVPKHLGVLHRCDTPICVRPDHLFLGSQADNIKDMASKNRIARGTDRNNSRMTEDSVRKMREEYRTGTITQLELAHAFGVAESRVCEIINYKAWAHVE